MISFWLKSSRYLFFSTLSTDNSCFKLWNLFSPILYNEQRQYHISRELKLYFKCVYIFQDSSKLLINPMDQKENIRHIRR
jgi:hypothetical protein